MAFDNVTTLLDNVINIQNYTSRIKHYIAKFEQLRRGNCETRLPRIA